ncbi:CHAT domain-containing protein [candidate division KSB1 bacterium]|nr:CHAT domain-containing protein [candidate division KSB1 bacterium]
MSETNLQPVIVLAFSNDRDNYLETIKEERKNIFNALQDYHDKGYILVHKEESTAIEDIFKLFRRYNDRIAIFHYGGHANGTHLQLEALSGQAEPAYADGLAQLMGRQKSLQLIFLNGCATGDQVKLLFDCGARLVIATSVSIEDKMAAEFAKQFYEELAAHACIKDAFDNAKAFSISTGKVKAVGEFRHLGLEEETAPTADMQWGLHINERIADAEKSLAWKLPDVKRMVDIGIAPSGQNVTPVNRVLIEMLSNELPRHSRDMARFLEDLEAGEKDERELPIIVIDSFPLPVGEQLRKLFSPELSAIHVQRLQQLVVTYEIIVKLLCSAALSEMWEDRYRDPELNISPQNRQMLQNYFELDHESHLTFNYIDLMAAVMEVLQRNHIDPFVAEFKDLPRLLQQEEFRQAHLYLESMRARLPNEKIAAEEIETLCQQSEKFLATIMIHFAFIVKYTLTTIKNINLIKYRHTQVRYRHTQVLLKRTTGREVMNEDAEKDYDCFAECKSVILLKSVRDMSHYLSLSPFVIDKNALAGGNTSDLYFYSFCDAAANSYHYQSIFNRQDTLIASERQFSILQQQFSALRQELLQD